MKRYYPQEKEIAAEQFTLNPILFFIAPLAFLKWRRQNLLNLLLGLSVTQSYIYFCKRKTGTNLLFQMINLHFPCSYIQTTVYVKAHPKQHIGNLSVHDKIHKYAEKGLPFAEQYDEPYEGYGRNIRPNSCLLWDYNSSEMIPIY